MTSYYTELVMSHIKNPRQHEYLNPLISVTQASSGLQTISADKLYTDGQSDQIIEAQPV